MRHCYRVAPNYAVEVLNKVVCGRGWQPEAAFAAEPFGDRGHQISRQCEELTRCLEWDWWPLVVLVDAGMEEDAANDLIDNLEVERALGHPPTAADYERAAVASRGVLPSLATVRHRCGGWQQALALAFEFSQ